LVLADVLAGFAHAQQRGIKALASLANLSQQEAEQFGAVLEDLPTLERITLRFEEAFPNLTGQSTGPTADGTPPADGR